MRMGKDLECDDRSSWLDGVWGKEKKAYKEDSSIGRLAGNSKNSLWLLSYLDYLRSPQGDWDGELNLGVSTGVAFRALKLNEAARGGCRQRGPGPDAGITGKVGGNHECVAWKRKKNQLCQITRYGQTLMKGGEADPCSHWATGGGNCFSNSLGLTHLHTLFHTYILVVLNVFLNGQHCCHPGL